MLTVTPGQFVFLRKFAAKYLHFWVSDPLIARSRVQISDLAPLYRTVGAALSTGCYVEPPRHNITSSAEHGAGRTVKLWRDLRFERETLL